MIKPLARQFFMRVSYDGSKYSGVRWNPLKKTVESTIDKFFETYVGKQRCSLRATSRTDKGVHAASNILHLRIKDPTRAINIDHLAYLLNHYLWKEEEDIRILELIETPFFRHPVELIKQREYVYRFAIFKEILVPVSKNTTVNTVRTQALPKQGLGNIFHEKSCVTLSPPFSVDKLLESAELLSGTTNIYNCTTSDGHREMERKKMGNKSYVRDIQVEVVRGHPMLLDLQPQLADKLEFWEIHFKSQSYINKQIRRMVGLMVGYAKEEYSLEFLKKVLSGQSLSHDDILTLHRPYATFSMPPQGLFLKNVELDNEMMEEASLRNPYIDLLANLSHLNFILHKNRTTCSSKPVTLKDLTQKTQAQLSEKINLNDLTLKNKGKDAKDFSLVKTDLGVVKVSIY
ncbi:tRNA pseudouridine synthase-like 1 [Crassostrea virginica]